MAVISTSCAAGSSACYFKMRKAGIFFQRAVSVKVMYSFDRVKGFFMVFLNILYHLGLSTNPILLFLHSLTHRQAHTLDYLSET